MEDIQKNETCACAVKEKVKSTPNTHKPAIWLLSGIIAVCTWWFVYKSLPAVSRFITYSLLGISKGTHMGEALEFFFYDTPKVMMLLVLVVFGVGIIRSYFTPEKTRDLLTGKREIIGNVMAAFLGIVTPFCSCSAVPLFIGFVTAGVPLGVTFSFLIAAPMVNEIALALLYGLVGWKVALLYAGCGLSVAVFAGWVIGRLKLERYVEDWVRDIRSGGQTDMPSEKLTWHDRVVYGWDAVKEIIGRVWIYVIIGIAVGAGIHGYVPQSFMASLMGKGTWWSVPLAVIMGVPMYSNAAGIIPVVEALLGKGAALGTVLAFMMSVIALSLPEMVILRKVLKIQLIAVFVGVVAAGILMVGYLFNYVI
ncbi:permease [Desulfobacterales bacterium HSG16]|nr:permease [Desulfobacterales bacterium HSG16]